MRWRKLSSITTCWSRSASETALAQTNGARNAALRRSGRAQAVIQERVAAPPATLRHPNHLLPLLPSGPGGVHKLSSRRHRRSHHKTCNPGQNEGRGGQLLRASTMPGTRLLHAVDQKLAEREGFEPSKRFNPLTHFPGVLLKPLGHLSANRLVATHRLQRITSRTSGPRRILGMLAADKALDQSRIANRFGQT